MLNVVTLNNVAINDMNLNNVTSTEVMLNDVMLDHVTVNYVILNDVTLNDVMLNDVKRFSGLSALHQAVLDNNLSVVKILISHGSDIDLQVSKTFLPVTVQKGLVVFQIKNCFLIIVVKRCSFFEHLPY